MNQHKWKSNRALKAVLAIVSVLTAVVVICSSLAVIVLGDMGVYTVSKEDTLKSRYEKYTEVYLAMAMANRESEAMQEYLAQTNFRYGIIKAEDTSKVDISDKTNYEYYNFEKMPKKDAVDKEEVRLDKILVNDSIRYSWEESLFGGGRIYYDKSKEYEEAVVEEEEVLITGYYYNVSDGIFYYATETEFYRVDEVTLPVGTSEDALMLHFKYDSGQHAYYNANPEVSLVGAYYVTFNQFDDTESSWQTWNEIRLDGTSFTHTDIRFVNDEYTYMGEFQGKPIADRYYKCNGAGLIIVKPKQETAKGAVEKEKKEETYLVVSQVRNPLQRTGIQNGILSGDLFEQITVVLDYAYAWRYLMIVVLAISLALWGISTVLVFVMAGHRGSYEMAFLSAGDENAARGAVLDTETDEAFMQENGGLLKTLEEVENRENVGKIKKRWVDAVKPGLWQKIPLDVETCIIAFLGFIVVLRGSYSSYQYLWNVAGLAAMFLASYILCFIWLTDFAVRIKLGRWWDGMLIYKCFAWIWRCIKRLGLFLRENISFLWKGMLILGGVSLLEFCGIVVTANNVGGEFAIWLFYRGITVVLVLFGIVQANRLREGAKKLADGNLQEKIKTDKMFWEFKKHGEDLNSIGDGMNLAVEKRMQSEHFRTELITNVSHDIKTPLTSIVNYVDLLQKEELHNEKAKEYLEVLSRQSARLKKLTEDLMEASKASTGSMPVQMEQLELGVFLTQTVGEFEEKLTAAGLRIVMHKSEQEILVNADGRHLWRVVENLVQNICKYAQPDTRVYIDLEETEREAVISFKNVSRYELNISGAELMERFVRGDSSRHTEGSGLGLSIAGSLMELMHGKLEIVVDGDLFKVVLRFLK